MAVVLIFGLLAAMVMPGLGSRGGRALQNNAERLAADFELARERSIVTGIPHRVLLDLDGGAYRMEWLVSESEALGIDPSLAPPEEPKEGIDLSAPRGDIVEFHPLPNEFGRVAALDDEVRFGAVETDRERMDRGAVTVGFDADGTAEATLIQLVDPGGNKLLIEIAPLDEAVRILDEES